MENRNIMILTVAFMALIVGAGLISVVAQEGLDKTTKIYVGNETFDLATARLADGGLNSTVQIAITNVPTGWKTTACPITSFVLRNQSGNLAMTLGTDYYFTTSTGLINLSNEGAMNSTGAGSNTSAVDYYYCADDYLVAGWNRTIIDLVPGFFALALMGVSIGLFYTVMKNEGLLGQI